MLAFLAYGIKWHFVIAIYFKKKSKKLWKITIFKQYLERGCLSPSFTRHSLECDSYSNQGSNSFMFHS
jgi:hypothetical protein